MNRIIFCCCVRSIRCIYEANYFITADAFQKHMLHSFWYDDIRIASKWNDHVLRLTNVIFKMPYFINPLKIKDVINFVVPVITSHVAFEWCKPLVCRAKPIFILATFSIYTWVSFFSRSPAANVTTSLSMFIPSASPSWVLQ